MNDDDGGYARHPEQFTGVTRGQVPFTVSVYKHTMTRGTYDFGDNKIIIQNHENKLFDELYHRIPHSLWVTYCNCVQLGKRETITQRIWQATIEITIRQLCNFSFISVIQFDIMIHDFYT